MSSVKRPTASGSPAGRTRRRGEQIGWAIALPVLLLVAVIVAAISLGALVPGLGVLSTVGNVLAPTLSPQFAIAGLAVGAISLLAWRRGFRRSGGTAALLGAGGFVANAAVVAVLVGAVSAGGGSVNIARATFGLSSLDSAAPDSVRIYDRTESGDDLTLSLFEPTDRSGDPAPVVLYVHGGGWTQGTATTTAADHRVLADAGYVVASVDYELATADNPTWDKAPGQVACAAVWLADNSAELNIDMDRFAFWGDSAGGNLSLNTAYAAAAGTAVSSCGGTVPVPAAVVTDYPATDVAAVAEAGFVFGPLDAAGMAETYVGGTVDEYPERYEAISTETYLSAAAPPTLVIEPSRDTLVPTDTVYDFVDAAEAAGVHIEVVPIPLSWHIYTQIASNSIGDQGHLTIGLAYLDERLR